MNNFLYLCSANQYFTIMENMKLISLRIEQEDAQIIEREAWKRDFYKASDIYRAGIRFAAFLAQEGQLDKLLHFYPKWGDVVDKFDFKYHRETRK